jgi:hypothetical protein
VSLEPLPGVSKFRSAVVTRRAGKAARGSPLRLVPRVATTSISVPASARECAAVGKAQRGREGGAGLPPADGAATTLISVPACCVSAAAGMGGAGAATSKMKGEIEMPRTTNSIAKAERFGVPSLETCTRIADEDSVRALQAAHYRLTARMRELELAFEAKASELRQAFLAETTKILSDSEEEEG